MATLWEVPSLGLDGAWLWRSRWSRFNGVSGRRCAAVVCSYSGGRKRDFQKILARTRHRRARNMKMLKKNNLFDELTDVREWPDEVKTPQKNEMPAEGAEENGSIEVEAVLELPDLQEDEQQEEKGRQNGYANVNQLSTEGKHGNESEVIEQPKKDLQQNEIPTGEKDKRHNGSAAEITSQLNDSEEGRGSEYKTSSEGTSSGTTTGTSEGTSSGTSSGTSEGTSSGTSDSESTSEGTSDESSDEEASGRTQVENRSGTDVRNEEITDLVPANECTSLVKDSSEQSSSDSVAAGNGRPETKPKEEQEKQQFTSFKVLVAGATGKTGRLIVENLAGKGATVRALVRDERKASMFKRLSNVEAVCGDLGHYETIKKALDDCNVIVCAIGSRAFPFDPFTTYKVEFEGVVNLLSAAKNQGKVKKFVFVSSIGVSSDFQIIPILWWKRQAELALQRSGLDYTIVRPGGLREYATKDESIQMKPPNSFLFGGISRSKVAEVCVEALVLPEASEKIVEIIAGGGSGRKSIQQLFSYV